MRKMIQVFSLLSLMFVFTAAGAFAQTGFGTEVEIPFAFNVGDRSYDAGHYIVKISRQGNGASLFSIQDTKTDDTQHILLNVNGDSVGSDWKLIFATIGDRKVVAAGDKGAAFWVLDRATGEIVWSKENLSSSHNPSNGGVLNNGAYDGEHFFFVSNQPPSASVLHAVNAADGTALWPAKSFSKIVWGMPSLANGLLVVPVNNELHIYNAATGAMLNMFDTVGTIAAGEPAIADGKIVVKSGMQYIFGGLDAIAGNKVIAYGLP